MRVRGIGDLHEPGENLGSVWGENIGHVSGLGRTTLDPSNSRPLDFWLLGRPLRRPSSPPISYLAQPIDLGIFPRDYCPAVSAPLCSSLRPRSARGKPLCRPAAPATPVAGLHAPSRPRLTGGGYATA